MQVLGARVAAARQAAGLTQAELARLVPIDRSALTKVELGGRRITALELARIAEALNVNVGDFFSDASPVLVSHRAGRDPDVALATVDQLIERLSRNVELVGELGLVVPGVSHEPLAFPRTTDEIEDRAAEVRDWLGVPEGPLADLAQAAETLGASTFCLTVDGVHASGAMVHLQEGAVVFVNGALKHGPRRITLAHEIGHLVFADDFSIDHDIGNESPSRREAKLDRFGRALLMPPDSMRAAWTAELELGRSPRDAAVVLASSFRVGTSQLALRLGEIDVIARSDARSLRSVTTTQSDFYEFDLLSVEEMQSPTLPSWYRKGVLGLYRRDQISAERAVDLLLETVDETELPTPNPIPDQAVWSAL